MATAALKLKQASAVLKVEPRDLQNLVQFGVVKPKRLEGSYVFDASTLLMAKVAICLKESLGTKTNVLTRLMEAFQASEKKLKAARPRYVVFTCRLGGEAEPIKLGVPFRSLEEQIQQGMGRASLYRDIPRGRKRPGWKKEFLDSLSGAAKELGELSEDEILRTIRTYKLERRTPEITVAAEI